MVDGTWHMVGRTAGVEIFVPGCRCCSIVTRMTGIPVLQLMLREVLMIAAATAAMDLMHRKAGHARASSMCTCVCVVMKPASLMLLLPITPVLVLRICIVLRVLIWMLVVVVVVGRRVLVPAHSDTAFIMVEVRGMSMLLVLVTGLTAGGRQMLIMIIRPIVWVTASTMAARTRRSTARGVRLPAAVTVRLLLRLTSAHSAAVVITGACMPLMMRCR